MQLKVMASGADRRQIAFAGWFIYGTPLGMNRETQYHILLWYLLPPVVVLLQAMRHMVTSVAVSTRCWCTASTNQLCTPIDGWKGTCVVGTIVNRCWSCRWRLKGKFTSAPVMGTAVMGHRSSPAPLHTRDCR